MTPITISDDDVRELLAAKDRRITELEGLLKAQAERRRKEKFQRENLLSGAGAPSALRGILTSVSAVADYDPLRNKLNVTVNAMVIGTEIGGDYRPVPSEQTYTFENASITINGIGIGLLSDLVAQIKPLVAEPLDPMHSLTIDDVAACRIFPTMVEKLRSENTGLRLRVKQVEQGILNSLTASEL